MLGQGSPQAAMLGHLGGVYITDTVEHTGQFGCIIAHEAAVADIITGTFPAPTDGSTVAASVMEGTLIGVILPVGVPFLGLFTSITLASGKVTAYKV